MPANKYALIRYRCIDKCLTDKYHKYPSRDYLREACEEALYGSQEGKISLSTIDKDLRAMRTDLELGYEAPIAFSKQYGGYFYKDPNYTIQKLPISEEGMEALSFAAHTLYQFREIPIFQQYEDVISKIRDSLAVQTDGLDESYLDYMMFEEHPEYTGTTHLTSILKAVKEKLYIQFSYHAFQSDKKKNYTLAPHLLKEYRKRWYVIGVDRAVDKIKTFGLERMKDVEITEDYFLREEEFDAKAYFHHSIGIGHYGKKPKKVELKVEKLQSKYMMSKPMHHSLKVIKEDKEYDKMGLEVILTHELVNELMAWSPYIEVVKPKELREMMIEKIIKMQKKYRL